MAVKVPVEDYGASVAEAIIELAEAVRNTPLKQRALVVMLNDITKVPKTDITYVLNAITRLEEFYLKANR